jgi:head-tail adaptor
VASEETRQYDVDQVTPPNIGSLRQRVAICATLDRPDLSGTLNRERPGVFWTYAQVLPIRAYRQVAYTAAFGSDKTPTHSIFIRMPHDVQVTAQHWVYYENQFSKRWLRIHAVQDINERQRMLWLLCRLQEDHDERNDPATDPLAPVVVETPKLKDIIL